MSNKKRPKLTLVPPPPATDQAPEQPAESMAPVVSISDDADTWSPADLLASIDPSELLNNAMLIEVSLDEHGQLTRSRVRVAGPAPITLWAGIMARTQFDLLMEAHVRQIMAGGGE